MWSKFFTKHKHKHEFRCLTPAWVESSQMRVERSRSVMQGSGRWSHSPCAATQKARSPQSLGLDLKTNSEDVSADFKVLALTSLCLNWTDQVVRALTRRGLFKSEGLLMCSRSSRTNSCSSGLLDIWQDIVASVADDVSGTRRTLKSLLH